HEKRRRALTMVYSGEQTALREVHAGFRRAVLPEVVMKTIVFFISLISALAITNAFAWERVLLDTYTAPQNWEISSQDLGLKAAKPFSVRMRTLHGGRQEGVCIV